MKKDLPAIKVKLVFHITRTSIFNTEYINFKTGMSIIQIGECGKDEF